MNKMIIGITQPRRVAAISLARRVSEELNESKVGGTVGYSVRFDEISSSKTRIKFLTDGMLVKECQRDPLLSRYAAIIIDEAHERTVRTDILIGKLKLLLDGKRRENLKVVIMSATIDTNRIQKYFEPHKSTIIKIKGRQHHVRTFYTSTPQIDYVDATVLTICQIHRDPFGYGIIRQSKKDEKKRPESSNLRDQKSSSSVKQSIDDGDILVFLTGQDEIDAATSLLREYEEVIANSTIPDSPLKRLQILPLYASMSHSMQMSVFSKAPPGTRKVILATNIAETSLTIPGIRIVIDSGMQKIRDFDGGLFGSLETLTVRPTSKAAARQRSGRAGREAPGIVFRLYTETSFDTLTENTPPEITRTPLPSVLLSLKATGIDDVLNFPFLDAPPTQEVIRALEELFLFGALNKKGKLTSVGHFMAACPLVPALAKSLVVALELGVSREVMCILSMLAAEVSISAPNTSDLQTSTDDDYVLPGGDGISKYICASGDHMTLLRVFDAHYSAGGNRKRWCRDHRIDVKAMRLSLDIFNQLARFLSRQTKSNLSKKINESSSTAVVSDSERNFENNTSLMEEEMKIYLAEVSESSSIIRKIDNEVAILKALCAGHFLQCATRQADGSYRTFVGRHTCYIHPSSTLQRLAPKNRPQCVIYHELTHTSRTYIRTLSGVNPVDIAHFTRLSRQN